MSKKENFDYGNKLPDGQYEKHPTDLSGEYVAPIRNTYIHTKCGGQTKMPMKFAETYAKNPTFYSNTFCTHCSTYPPISEFVWIERGRKTNIVLGTIQGEPGLDLTR